MNRQDLFAEFSDFIFDLTPSGKQADDQVSREDVESLRLACVRICDRVAIKVAEDCEFTPDDASDEAHDLECEREDVGRD